MTPHDNPFALRGKTLLVTGATSGIGRATAVLCSRLGARIFLTGRDGKRLDEALHALAGKGHRAVAADLARIGDIDRLVDTEPELDGLVCSAGFNLRRPLPTIRPEDMEGLFAVHAFAPIQIVSRLVKAKRLRKGASVVFVSSLAGRGLASVGNGVYAAAKAAVSAFARHAALELAGKGIRANSVAPGVVETPFLAAEKYIAEDQWRAERETYPLKRFGTPEDVANAIAFLLSDASSWVTGTELVVDGGRSLK